MISDQPKKMNVQDNKKIQVNNALSVFLRRVYIVFLFYSNIIKQSRNAAKTVPPKVFTNQ